jgi:type IV secretion system protein VirB11
LKNIAEFQIIGRVGHPGSMTTVHANSPAQAYDRLALMSVQAGLGLSKAEIVDYIRSVIPVVIQLSRHEGRRGPSEIQFMKMAKVA